MWLNNAVSSRLFGARDCHLCVWKFKAGVNGVGTGSLGKDVGIESLLLRTKAISVIGQFLTLNLTSLLGTEMSLSFNQCWVIENAVINTHHGLTQVLPELGLGMDEKFDNFEWNNIGTLQSLTRDIRK